MSLKPVRRVVTGHTVDGHATVHIDDAAQETLEFPTWPDAGCTELWRTDEAPADLDTGEDRAQPMQHDPSPHGSLFRVVQIPPEGVSRVGDPDAVYDAMGSAHRPEVPNAEQHPTMHRTDSLDYLVVISGVLTMIMGDGSEVDLHPGDCVVQQGTDHAWANRGYDIVQLAAVLIDATPPAALR